MPGFDIVEKNSAYYLDCSCCDAVGVLEEYFVEWDWDPQYRLSPVFKRWLIDHRGYLIKMNIESPKLYMKFPTIEAAMAFKLCWL